MIITASDIRRRIAPGVALLSGIALFTAPAAAAWTLIDDFQDYNTGDIRDNVTGGVWTALGNTSLATIEQEGINQYLAFGWRDGHRSAARELPSFAQLPAGAGSATYFQRYRSNGMDTADASFGLTGPNLNTSSTAPFGDFRVQVRISDTGNHEVDIRDGDSFVDTGARIERDEWFNFWMVVHRDPTAGDRWDLYMTPGANTPDPANDLIYSSAAFRSAESGPLQHYLAIANPAVNRGPNLDALYFSPGVNLSWAALGAVWTGAASDRWRTADNWDRAAAFPNGWSDILTFGPSAEPSVVIDGGDHLRVHTMRFVADAPAYTIDAEDGRLLRIADGGGVNVESGVTTDQHFGITLRPRLGTTTYRNDGTGLLSFDRMETDWDGSGNAHLVFTGSGDIRAQRLDDREAPGGSQPRTMSVEKDGSGTLTLAGSSTFSGDVRVRRGILNVQHSNALGVGSKTVHARGDSGAFTVELEGGITLAENITWQTSNQSLTSPAIRNVSGDNRILGEIRMEGGGGHTAVVVDGGTLELAAR